MPMLSTFGQLGGLLASLVAITSPPIDDDPDSAREGPNEAPEPGRFQLSPADPRASDYQRPVRRVPLESVLIPLRISNHIIGVFGVERPLAYGLDLQLGVDVRIRRDRVGLAVRPETGYAFVHSAEFDSHASITGVGVCLLVIEAVDLCYTPSFVAGSEARELSLGLRHGLALALDRWIIQAFSIEVQHGVAWVGSAEARHELRGALTLDVTRLAWHLDELLYMTRL